ncbi:MAG: hypothetical protein M1594_00715 [Candidatus Marsarchaeota archaeon]|nr:hypothetical protein [Candidatus Marsarchaeota archaeon]
MREKSGQGSLFNESLKEVLEPLPILSKHHKEVGEWNLNKRELDEFKEFGLKVHAHILKGENLEDIKRSYPLNPLIKMPTLFEKGSENRYEKAFKWFKSFEKKKEEYIQDVKYFKENFSKLQDHFNEMNLSKFENDKKAFDFFFASGKGYFKAGKLPEFLFYARIKPEELGNMKKIKERLNEDAIRKALEKIEAILSKQ